MNVSYLAEHVGDLLNSLSVLGYSEISIGRYKTVIFQILNNASSENWTDFTDIFEWYKSRTDSPTTLEKKRAILSKIEHFCLTRQFPTQIKVGGNLYSHGSYDRLCSSYREMVDYYIDSDRKRGIKESTIHSRKCKISSILFTIQKQGCESLNSVTDDIIMNCFIQDGKVIRAHTSSVTFSAFVRACEGLYIEDSSSILAMIPCQRSKRKNVQFLTNDEVVSLRESLDDYSNDLSYKDRAIGFILLYTGMRAGDVASLRLDSFDLVNNRIYLTQQKTAKDLDIPLIPVVGNAVIDYCGLERPNVNSDYLFLSKCAPYSKTTSYAIESSVDRLLKAANIRQSPGDRRGTHIFRYHFATTMLSNGVSQPVITESMGHSQPLSLEPYLFADLAHLKECAIDISPYNISEEVFSHVF